MSRPIWIPRAVACTCVCLEFLLLAVAARAAQPSDSDLKRLSLEELMQVDVTTAARRPEPLGETPAAVTIVTGEEIRRSGVTTIADAVALAGGVHVARFNNGAWSVATRGFNSVTSNKMLVMVDGRTVYSPLFTGVFWNALDYTLDDIDRVEVIRGPGAVLWGANAVNGVINIVTRHTRDTRGTFVQIGAGNEDPGLADVRYGGSAGNASYRVYGRYAGRASQTFSDGSSAGDRRVRGQAGFRIDRGNSLMLTGDTFYSRNEFPDRADGEFTLADLQLRWMHVQSPRSELQVQAYFNHEYRRIPLQLTHRLNTVDLDVQQAYTASRHGIVWGGGVRINHDRTEGTAVLSFDPSSRTYPVSNVFAQDDISIVRDRAYVTMGLKLEHNAFSGLEVQPNLRGRVLLPHRQMVWSSVARAVRRPTRFEDDIVVVLPNGLVAARGNDDFLAERLIASEAGYRVQPGRAISIDATLFLHRYDRLRSQESPASGPPIPIVVGNTLNGESKGLELQLNLQPLDRWRTNLWFTRQSVSITRDPGSRDVGGGATEANDPDHIFGIRTALDLPRGVLLDARLRTIGRLPNPSVPGYTELAIRAAWRIRPRVELSVTGEDLLHDRHAEFNPVARGFEEFERSVRAGVAVWIP